MWIIDTWMLGCGLRHYDAVRLQETTEIRWGRNVVIVEIQ
jgi:hypothetical protein